MLKNHPEYDAMLKSWQWARMFTSEDAVYGAGDQLLPRLAAMKTDVVGGPQHYELYLAHATLWLVLPYVIDKMVGELFRKEPKIQVPDFLEADATGNGDPMLNLAEQVATEVSHVGRCALVIDWPDASATPVVRLYNAESLVRWEGDGNRLTSVVFKEEAADGGLIFGATLEDAREPKTQYRCYYLDENGKCNYAVYDEAGERSNEGSGLVGRTGRILERLPVVIINSGHIGASVTTPPLDPLIRLNRRHYIMDARLNRGIDFGTSPTIWVAGADKNQEVSLVSGRMGIVKLPDEDSKMGMLEYQGAVLPIVLQRLDSLARQMIALGGRMFEPKGLGQVAAETVRHSMSGERCVLSAISRNISRGLTMAAEIAAELYSGGKQSVEIRLNADFDGGTSTDVMRTLTELWKARAVSYATLYQALKAQEVPFSGSDAEAERAAIEAESSEIDALVARLDSMKPEVDDGTT